MIVEVEAHRIARRLLRECTEPMTSALLVQRTIETLSRELSYIPSEECRRRIARMARAMFAGYCRRLDAQLLAAPKPRLRLVRGERS